MNKLDEELEKARLACEREFPPNTSLIEQLRPWVHYNNLLQLKTNKLLNNEDI